MIFNSDYQTVHIYRMPEADSALTKVAQFIPKSKKLVKQMYLILDEQYLVVGTISQSFQLFYLIQILQ